MARLSDIVGAGVLSLASLTEPYSGISTAQQRSQCLPIKVPSSKTSIPERLNEVIEKQLACKPYGSNVLTSVSPTTQNNLMFTYHDGFKYAEGKSSHTFATYIVASGHTSNNQPLQSRYELVTLFVDNISLGYNYQKGIFLASTHNQDYDLGIESPSNLHRAHRGHQQTYPIAGQSLVPQEHIKELMGAVSGIIASKYSGSISQAQLASLEAEIKRFKLLIGAKSA